LHGLCVGKRQCEGLRQFRAPDRWRLFCLILASSWNQTSSGVPTLDSEQRLGLVLPFKSALTLRYASVIVVPNLTLR
jgi:hypothetical protein